MQILYNHLVGSKSDVKKPLQRTKIASTKMIQNFRQDQDEAHYPNGDAHDAGDARQIRVEVEIWIIQFRI